MLSYLDQNDASDKIIHQFDRAKSSLVPSVIFQGSNSSTFRNNNEDTVNCAYDIVFKHGNLDV